MRLARSLMWAGGGSMLLSMPLTMMGIFPFWALPYDFLFLIGGLWLEVND